MSLFQKKEPAPLSRRAAGYEGEKLAAAFLEKQNFEVLERNFTIRGGEIDLIAREGGCLVFVEVKLRKAENAAYFGRPARAVGPEKQKRMIRAASIWLAKHPSPLPARFDVVEIEYTEKNGRKEYDFHHIPDAFIASDPKALF